MTDGVARRVAVADIGGTNARFATANLRGSSVSIEETAIFGTQEFRTIAEAWNEFSACADLRDIGELGISFAGPVGKSPVRLTNGQWSFDPHQLAASLGLQRVTVVNDLAAIARTIPVLPDGSFRHVCGPVSGRPAGPLTSVVGLGTGLGLALLVDDGFGPRAFPCEGGHVGFAPQTETDLRLFAWLQGRYGRVSAERIVSGNALPDLIGALGGHVTAGLSNQDLWKQALQGGDPLHNRAINTLLASLGSIAGDFALAQGSQSVVLAGGLMARLQDRLAGSAFAECFAAKGRLSDYASSIPVFLFDNDQAGLIGAALSIPAS